MSPSMVTEKAGGKADESCIMKSGVFVTVPQFPGFLLARTPDLRRIGAREENDAQAFVPPGEAPFKIQTIH